MIFCRLIRRICPLRLGYFSLRSRIKGVLLGLPVNILPSTQDSLKFKYIKYLIVTQPKYLFGINPYLEQHSL
jgi:hypothetical protein